jgi:hypothetical protein
MALVIRGSAPTSVFQLNGSDENSATHALGWVLQQSLTFRKIFVESVLGEPVDVTDATLSLQRHGEDGGYTDLEIHSGKEFHIVVEAKKGWQIPSIDQLSKYRPRMKAGGGSRQRLVSISSARTDIVEHTLPTQLDGAALIHLSWRDIQRMAATSNQKASGVVERLWLRQLVAHLEEFVAMARFTDNTVYVVSLGLGPMVAGGTHTWIDVVEKDCRYFHRVGKTWPSQPPNYVGFRYHGKLQSVHHVDSFQIAADVSTINPLWLPTRVDHFIYRLGPPMKPVVEIRTGAINRNARCTCSIDTLLSGAFTTIGAARDETKRRLAEYA